MDWHELMAAHYEAIMYAAISASAVVWLGQVVTA